LRPVRKLESIVSDPELVVHPQLRWKRPFAEAESALEGSRNCACAVGAALVEWATRGDRTPSHHDFRKKAGSPLDSKNKPRGLASSELAMAYDAFEVDCELRRGKSFELVRNALSDGHAISACLDYGTINREAPQLSGQRTFKGGHHVALLGFTPHDPRTDGANSTTVFDPLFDGRTKPWGTAPQGPQLAPIRFYRHAMGNFRVGGTTYASGHPLGDGLGTFLIVKRRPLRPGEGEPAGPPLTDLQVADLKAKLEEAQAQIDALKALIGIP
jgi:hypothetical protein